MTILVRYDDDNDSFFNFSLHSVVHVKTVKKNIVRKPETNEDITNNHWARVVDYCPLALKERERRERTVP